MLNPLGAALKRIEPHVGSASTSAIEARLNSLGQPDPRLSTAARIAREPAIRDAISRSCLEWIETDRFPMATPATAFFLYERLDCAYSFGEWLLESGFEAPKKTANEALAWLLVDC